MPATTQKRTAYVRVEIDGTKPITRGVKHAASLRVSAKSWTDQREVEVEVQTVKGYPVVYVSLTRVEQDGTAIRETHKLEMN